MPGGSIKHYGNQRNKNQCYLFLASVLHFMEDHGTAIGFVMGYFKQYDDIVGYTLEEIVIAAEYQNKGIGSTLLQEPEICVRQRGAACIELQAVADEQHEHYYGKAGYHNAQNFAMKVKWFE